MTRDAVVQAGDFRVSLLRDPGPERERCEAALRESSDPALMQSSTWARAHPRCGSWLLAVHDLEGTCVDGLRFEVTSSRAMPGHRILRADHVRKPSSPEARAASAQGLVRHARAHGRILRVGIEFFALDDEVRAELAAPFEEVGFRPATAPRSYGRTVVLDLQAEEDEIFAGFHKKCRRDIRATLRKGTEARAIVDPEWAPRLRALTAETMGRTGGDSPYRDWARVIEMSRDHPDRSRLVGLFDVEADGPGSLLAFAWGCFHGDHGQYYFAASTRDTGKNISVGYVPLWELIRWSRRQGGRWFDLGGITGGSVDGSDPLGGISDFKRYFSRDVREVGVELELEPSPWRARVARAIGSVARRVRSTVDRTATGESS